MVSPPKVLLSEVESFDDGPVSFDIDFLQILQQLATFSDQTQKGALRTEIVLVAFEVIGKVADTIGKQRDLTLWRAGIGVRLPVLTEKLLLFLC